MLKGVDISSHQSQPDFSKVKEVVDFVIVKATEGVGFRDPQLTRNQRECRKLGITLGYYAFVRPDLGNSPEAEAQYFLDQIGPLEEGELLFLDFEVSYNDRVNWCKKWLDHVYKQTKVKAPIYLNKTLEKSSDWRPVIDADYGLWIADYTHDQNSPIPPVQWPVVAFRQYSSEEKILGIDGNVDGNVFYGDKDALKAYGFKGVSSDDCEKKLADARHVLITKGNEITKLEEALKITNKNFGVLEIQCKLARGTVNIQKTEIEELDSEVKRLQAQRFELHEILNFFLIWLKTGGDSKKDA